MREVQSLCYLSIPVSFDDTRHNSWRWISTTVLGTLHSFVACDKDRCKSWGHEDIVRIAKANLVLCPSCNSCVQHFLILGRNGSALQCHHRRR